MSESKVVQKLDELARLRQQVVTQTDALEDIPRRWLPQEAFDEIDELKTTIYQLTDQAKALEAEIKAAVIEAGKSVRGAELLATWNKPRVTWDGKGLEGFAVAHPEIKAFRKEGKPSCSIRKAPKPKAEPPSAPPEVTTPPMTDLSDASVKGAGFRLKVARFVAGGA